LPNNVQESIDRNSTVDLSKTERFYLPAEFAFFVNSGYPYTRLADLGETAIVLPDQLAAPDIETFLTLMGTMGIRPGTRSCTPPSLLPRDHQVADKDLIVIGAIPRQPLIARWARNSNLAVDGGRLRVRDIGDRSRLHEARPKRRPAEKRADRPVAGVAGRQFSRHLIGMQSRSTPGAVSLY